MNKLFLVILVLFSISVFAEGIDPKSHINNKPIPDSVFDVIPLNSPVKESVARFVIKTPDSFKTEEVSYQVKNSGRIFEIPRTYQKVSLIAGPEGAELRIDVSKFSPGFYQLRVKIKDKSKKEHDFKTKYKDHAMFIVDRSSEVPMPDPKKNNATIAGIDSDGDGIRDDIQIWINKEFQAQPKVQMAMRQIAMGRQLDLLSIENREQSILVSKNVLNNTSCLFFVIGLDTGAKLIREIESKLLNTKDRLYAEIKSNENFSGQAYELPRTAEEEKALCSFNPDSF